MIKGLFWGDFVINYRKFNEIIESQSVVSEELYKQLIDNYGEEVINFYFEKYIDESNLSDKQTRLKRVSYYIKLCDQRIFKDISLGCDDLLENDKYELDLNYISKIDISKLYFNDIGTKKILTLDEEVEFFNKINAMKQKVNNISIEKNNILLERYGYKLNGKKDNTVKGLEDKLFYLEKLFVDLSENCISIEDVKELKELIADIKDCYNYQVLIDEFMSYNFRLVLSVAKRYYGSGIDFLDLVQEGNIGLKKAVERFDVSKGYKFSTYAVWWINQSITRSIAEHSRIIRVPVHFNDLMYKVNKIKNVLEIELMRIPTDDEVLERFYALAKSELIRLGNMNPTDDEIKKKANIDKKKLNEMKLFDQPIASLYTPVADDEESILLDFISDFEYSTENDAIFNVQKDYIRNMLDCLSDREKIIILTRYGLNLNEYITFDTFKDVLSKYTTMDNLYSLYLALSNNSDLRSLQKVGNLFSISRERVNQIEKKCLKRLKVVANKKGLSVY